MEESTIRSLPAGWSGEVRRMTYTARKDPVCAYLIERAKTGEVPAHRAWVPLAAIFPFDPAYRVQDVPLGRMLLRRVMEAWREGLQPAALVYPRWGGFVLPDDYLYYEAARRMGRSELHCLVIGRLGAPGLRDPEGPLAPHTLQRALAGR